MKLYIRLLAGLLAALSLQPALASLAIVPAGATSQQLQVRAVVQSTGAPDTALAYNTSGLSCSYQRPGSALTSITLATQTVTGAYSSGGFVHVGNGWYRLDIPNAAIATGVSSVLVTCAATGDTFVDGRVELSPSVNMALVGGQTASASGTVTFPNATLASTSNITTVGAVSGSVGSVTGNVGGNVTGSVGSVVGAVGSVTGNVGGNVTGSVGSVTTVSSGAISEASFACSGGSFKTLGIEDCGTAQSATGTTLVLRSAAAFADNTLIGATVVACGSTQGYCQSRAITAYTGSTDTATVATWDVTPAGTITYYVFGTAPGSGGGSLTAADVWTYGTRTVTAATNITSSGGTIPITASRVDASVGAYQTGLTPLQPTTAGRTLDVSATGEAGIDWANVGSPTTTVNLSGTTISTSQAVASVSGAVGSVTGNVGGNVTGSVGSVATNGITAASLATDAGTELASATWDLSTTGHTTGGTFGAAMVAAGSAGDPWATLLPGSYGAGTAGYILGTNLNATVSSRLAPTTAGRTLDVTATGAAGIDWGNVENPTTAVGLTGTTISTSQAIASVSGAVGSVTGAVGSVTGNVGGNVTGSVGSLGATAQGNVRTAVGLASANLDTQLGTLATASALSTVASYIDTEVAAIKAKTDSLTFTVAGQVDANTESMNGAAVLGNGTSGNLWRGQ